MYRPKNKEERLQLRQVYLDGYTVTENKEADCTIATRDKNGRFYLMVFDGTAARPCFNCWYGTNASRQRAIDYHCSGRMESIKYKQERKQAKNAAGAYVVDESKPHFEVGREYFMNWYNDDPWEHTSIIRVIKRTACFVTISHVHNGEIGDTQRVKVSVDKGGEYLSWGSFYYFRAESVVHHEAEEERQDRDRKEQEEEAAKVEAFHREQDEGRAFVEQTAAAHPILEGAPVVTIEWSEHPAFYSWEDGDLKLSVAAAEIVLRHFDEERAERNASEGRGGYYKTKFVIEYTADDGERHTYEGRYDLGDNDGGLIAHIRAFAESKRKPGYFHDEEAAEEIMALADILEANTAAGRVVSVSMAPWLEEAVRERQKAAERARRQEAEDFKAAIEMLTDKQLAAAVLNIQKDDKEKLDVARFFLQVLHDRDAKKSIEVFKAWRAGAGMEFLDEI